MNVYFNLLQAILDNGVKTGDRTGTGTMTLPGYHYTCPLEMDENGIIHNFPLLTTKEVDLEQVFIELMWKLNGQTNIRPLIEKNCHIWSEWPLKKWLQETNQTDILNNMWEDEGKTKYSKTWKTAKKQFEERILTDKKFCKKWGELGHTYGYQFRHFGEVNLGDVVPFLRFLPIRLIKGKDQLMSAVDRTKNKPEDRRIIISLWNPQDENKTLLPPCPCFYQFFANEAGMLHLNMYQRSCDTFLGVPYNTAQDALLLCLMAHVTGRKPGRFNHFFGDAHIYLNHIDQVKEQISRTPHQLPSIRLNPNVKDILDFTWEDIELIGYEHEKAIRAPVSI